MSKIYHGSTEVVKIPEIRQSNRSLDYGEGFYTTTSLAQAKRFGGAKDERQTLECWICEHI